MCQRAFDHIGEDLHLAVRMRAEAAARLHQIVVHHAQDAEVALPRVPLGEGEVEP